MDHDHEAEHEPDHDAEHEPDHEVKHDTKKIRIDNTQRIGLHGDPRVGLHAENIVLYKRCHGMQMLSEYAQNWQRNKSVRLVS